MHVTGGANILARHPLVPGPPWGVSPGVTRDSRENYGKSTSRHTTRNLDRSSEKGFDRIRV